MLDELTPQQRCAATYRGGKLLVSAAAGSGKTRVLVERLMAYLTDPDSPAELDEFLIITYTKAAASELRGKISAELNARIALQPENRHLRKQLQRLYLTQISTVHGFCTKLLRENVYRLDIAPDFRVADETQCAELRQTVLSDTLDEAYTSREGNEAFFALVDTQGLGRDDRALPELIEKVYNSARCHLDPEGWLNSCAAEADDWEGLDASATPWGAFLLDAMRRTVRGHRDAMAVCCARAERVDGFDKVAANLSSSVAALDRLLSAESWDEAAERFAIDFGSLRFPKKNNDLELTGQIKAVRDACKAAIAALRRRFSQSSEQLLGDMAQSREAVRGLVTLVRRFSENYERAKRARRVLDFGDLEHRTLDLLLGKRRSGPTALSREIAARYREVLVDEYQDSNAVQDAIFSVLTREKGNCFMVGDVKQSIYRFRLADPGIFLDKYSHYTLLDPDAPEGGGERKALLSHNFRSGGEIIGAVNDVFTQCMSAQVGGMDYTAAEALHEGKPHVPLPDPAVELYALETSEDAYRQEAAFVASRVRQLLDTGACVRDGDTLRPVRPEDIVLLLRSPGSVGADFQHALERQGIRCAIGGGMDLLKTPEVQSLCALLRTVVNPRQDIPLVGTLASPLFGFTADDLAAVRGGRTKGSFYDALASGGGKKTENFVRTLAALRREARVGTVTSLLSLCFRLTRIDSVYAAMPEGEARRENLRQFYCMAADFENGGAKTLPAFMSYLDTLTAGAVAAASGGSAGCVTIMSIHRSKGLEFPVVFLCNLARKFNRTDLTEQVLCDPELGLGLYVADTAQRLRYPSLARLAIAEKLARESADEELRVLYVAMTRARDRLIMTYAAKNVVKRLTEIAGRLPFDGGKLLCAEAERPGDWVLLTAMGRVEAGQLHAEAGSPGKLRTDDYPWKIQLVEGVAEELAAEPTPEEHRTLPAGEAERLREALAFHYPHAAATTAPSKQTATGKKGREKDEEAAEHTRPREVRAHTLRRASFGAAQSDPLARGTAIHAAMQYIRFAACDGASGVDAELARLAAENFLTRQQADVVPRGQLAAFFATPIGRKLRAGAECLREFKFSILEPGEATDPKLKGEEILTQGVVDCALLEDDGIILLDFKTDRVTPETVPAAAARYTAQLDTYADALARIFQKQVKQKLLYFFTVGEFAEVK